MKCPACESRKGKRHCQRQALAAICSQCCGQTREAASCLGCGFYKPPSRDYGHLPRFSPEEMDNSIHLQQIAFPIEALVCSLDLEKNFTMSDAQAIELFEILLDIYAFAEHGDALAERIVALDCASAIDSIESALAPFDRSTIAQVLAAVRYVAVRRAHVGRDHLDVLQAYCGAFVESGVGSADGDEVVGGG